MTESAKLRHPLLVAVLAVAVLGACSPIALTAGAGAATTVAASEARGLGGTTEDWGTRIAVNDLWFKHDEEMHLRVDLQIYEGRLLLTGLVPREDMRTDAVRLAWQPENVKEVINEIKIGGSRAPDVYATDKFVTTQLKAKLLLTKGISSINYSLTTIEGTVYLLGVAQSQEELDRVFSVVRNQANVQDVVSHVLLRDDPRRTESG